MVRRIVGLVAGAVIALAVIAAPALAAGTTSSATPAPALPGSPNPFSPGVPISPPNVPTATTPAVVNPTTASTSSSSGLSGTDAILIAIGAAVLLGGISYFIWYDARRRAPVAPGHGAAETVVGRASGSKRPPKPRKLSPAERKRRKRGRARP